MKRWMLNTSLTKMYIILSWPHWPRYYYSTFVSNHFHSVKSLLFSSARSHDFDGMLGTGLPVSMYTTKTPIDIWRFNVPQLKEFLTFSVKDRYQLNYFICIKDFNAQPIISLELNLFFSFIYCRQHHQRKTICFYIFLFSETVGYRTPVFIQPFSWCLHITITYHLPHLRLWYVDVVTVIA
jgi:hypothetical protein